jgi:hypothetical protein
MGALVSLELVRGQLSRTPFRVIIRIDKPANLLESSNMAEIADTIERLDPGYHA